MRPGGKILYPASLYHFERVICAVSEREHLDQTGSTHYLVILIYHYPVSYTHLTLPTIA